MREICELTDQLILGTPGLSHKPPRITARALVRRQDGLYAVMYAEKWRLYSLPGGGVEDGEDVLDALRREIWEETGCTCDVIRELGIVRENRASLDYTQINHYFVVDTAGTSGGMHLTAAEEACRTGVQWHTLEDAVRLIGNQHFDRVQGKYLRARDVAALQAYTDMQ